MANSSNNEVVESVISLVAASQHKGTSVVVAEGSPQHVDRNSFLSTTFRRRHLHVSFLELEILTFDKNWAVVL